MAIILNIETATKNCSVSLSKNGKTIFFKEHADQGYSHAEKLHVFIDQVIKECQINISEINAVAVSKGPGSYTGLRIGVSAAKGLCYALNIPLIAVDTLEILANQVQKKDGLIVPMLDARRMEVYSAIFNNDLEKISETKAEILSTESYAEINEKIYFVGDCQEKCQTVLTKNNFEFLPEIVYPSANEMSKISYQKFENKQFEDVAYFEPFYLKDFLLTK
ncbi:tRNA (adenosine(37)-N6)-threonylcarbamoyltransferase complex dimerization subunit type 1 TsaB [Flavobacterium sp.]|uniref:tRNA (adenosine(37)-N6)-threonylcarbamoyltransferase complex dimerization subunit type 1 TsaB n=1 Tax=Flavobacterium sp. TaxID=239 RepID=UPI0035B331ED